jgi:hypothetical protein
VEEYFCTGRICTRAGFYFTGWLVVVVVVAVVVVVMMVLLRT